MSARIFPIFIASQYFASGSLFPVLEDNIVRRLYWTGMGDFLLYTFKLI